MHVLVGGIAAATQGYNRLATRPYTEASLGIDGTRRLGKITTSRLI
jgi:hypothetical protein